MEKIGSVGIKKIENHLKLQMLLKRIDEFEKYWISLNGQVWSESKGDFLKQRTNDGYWIVTLRKDNKGYTKRIHRLLAEAFIQNPNNYPVVDHIDRNRKNNSLENLRWSSIQKNNHNTNYNREIINIEYRPEYETYRVIFRVNGFKCDRSFQKLEKAKEFKGIIQNKIDNKEPLDKVFIELFDNDMKHIYKRTSGTFNLVIKKPNLKFYKTYILLQEAKTKRNELLNEYYENKLYLI